MTERLLTIGVLLVLAGCRTSPNALIGRLRKDPTPEAVVELGDYLAEKEASGQEFDEGDLLAMELLRDLVRTETQPLPNRMCALSVLRRIRSVDSTDLYLEALEDSYWSVRWEAAKCLASQPRTQASGKLSERLRNEERPEVLLDLINALAAIGDRTSVRALLEAFVDPSSRYRNHRLKLHAAVRRLTGQSYELTNREAWQSYLETEFPAPPSEETAPSTEGDKGETRPEETQPDPVPRPVDPTESVPEKPANEPESGSDASGSPGENG